MSDVCAIEFRSNTVFLVSKDVQDLIVPGQRKAGGVDFGADAVQDEGAGFNFGGAMASTPAIDPLKWFAALTATVWFGRSWLEGDWQIGSKQGPKAAVRTFSAADRCRSTLEVDAPLGVFLPWRCLGG